MSVAERQGRSRCGGVALTTEGSNEPVDHPIWVVVKGRAGGGHRSRTGLYVRVLRLELQEALLKVYPLRVGRKSTQSNIQA